MLQFFGSLIDTCAGLNAEMAYRCGRILWRVRRPALSGAANASRKSHGGRAPPPAAGRPQSRAGKPPPTTGPNRRFARARHLADPDFFVSAFDNMDFGERHDTASFL